MRKNKLTIPFDVTLEKKQKVKSFLLDLIKTIVILLITISLSEVFILFDFNSQILIMVPILSVLIISRITSGYFFGIVASGLNSFVYDFLVTAPRMGFSFTLGFPIILCTMLIVTFITCASTIQIKLQAKLALEREQRAQLLYEISQQLLASRTLESIVRITNEYLIGHIQRSVVFYTQDPYLPDSGTFAPFPSDHNEEALFNTPEERMTAHTMFVDAPACDDVFQSENGVYYAPIVSKGKKLGLIGVSCARRPLTQSGITFIQTVMAQVALALELQYLSDEQNKLMMHAEREKTHAMLLRAISHDLRTPLTGILGASATILEQKGRLTWDIAGRLITDIHTNAQWLIRIVENLLSITKISNSAMKLNKTLEAAEEVVAQSVSIVRQHFPDWQIHIRGPKELLFVPMESTLISQVLINLLENSVKNSKSGSLILVDIKNHGNRVEFSVSDHGKGIPEQILDNLFETYTVGEKKAVDSVQGMGIGLALCKTIIHAHGGTIVGKNKKNKGAYFSFFLPVGEEDHVKQ